MKSNKKSSNNIYDVPIKYSISRRFALIFILLLVGTILICWLLNSTLLNTYYQRNKQKTLVKAYESINKSVENGNLTSDSFQTAIQKMSSFYNIDVIILDEDSKTIISSVRDSNSIVRRLLDNIFADKSKGEVLVQTDVYTIEKYHDHISGGKFLSMWGVLENGNLFMMRTAMEGIRESVIIANRFLAYIGIIVAITGGFVVLFVAKRITAPILELAELSQRMSKLDFDAKYDGKMDNEIGVLGAHFNEMSNTLERTISELKTANNELQNDIVQKEEIDEMRKEFLANVSHELKTPIALVLGYAEGLKDCIHDDDDSKDFYCDVIIDEAEKMDTMVKKLLTLNQLEFGNDTVVMERFDMVTFVRNYIQSADILIKQNEVSVDIFSERDSMYVWGDEFKVEEVFMNFFSNALNHVTEPKEIRISIKDYENVVRVSVFNTGKPIPEESIDHLWDKFYKVDKARTREYGGSGVGLSIVKAIMESMNQKYGVVNREDGVEFWFELESK